MSQVMIICRGVALSGKSSWAIDWKWQDPSSRVIVERDRIRYALWDEYHSEDIDENLVTKIEDSSIDAALAAGFSVVVADTNLKHSYVKRLAAIAQKRGVPVEVKVFDEPLDVLLARNAQRDRKVPEDVIRDMYKRFQSSKGPIDLDPPVTQSNQYTGTPGKPDAYIVDVDGSVARMIEGGRSPYDWHRVGEDEPVKNVIRVVNNLYACGNDIIVMSGRDEVCREQTANWLREVAHMDYCKLLMRPAGDTRKDTVIKQELFDKYVRNEWNILGAIDDRWAVCRDVWLAMGMTVFNVSGLDRGEF